jgi:hypothetical protein
MPFWNKSSPLSVHHAPIKWQRVGSFASATFNLAHRISASAVSHVTGSRRRMSNPLPKIGWRWSLRTLSKAVGGMQPGKGNSAVRHCGLHSPLPTAARDSIRLRTRIRRRSTRLLPSLAVHTMQLPLASRRLPVGDRYVGGRTRRVLR